jgi:hypothetical protein
MAKDDLKRIIQIPFLSAPPGDVPAAWQPRCDVYRSRRG